MSGSPLSRRWDPFRDLQREVGRLFETLEPLQNWRLQRPFPAINLYDARDKYILNAELPGLAPEEIELSIAGETLTLRGERKLAEGVSDENFRRQERQFGRWSRSITLPDRIDGPGVSAQFANGILTVTLPKAVDAQPRQITISPVAG
jgi:HSP20 family protein